MCIVKSGCGYILDKKTLLMISDREKALLMLPEEAILAAEKLRSIGIEARVEIVE